MYRGIIKLTALIKLRSYSRSSEELWLHEYTSPLASTVHLHSDNEYYDFSRREVDTGSQEYALTFAVFVHLCSSLG